MIDISKAVHDYVLVERESESGKLYPSSLGGCIRASMYRFHKHPKTHPFPPLLLWDFERFKWYEGVIAEALKHSVTGLQVPVVDLFWSGKIDMTLHDNELSEAYLCEDKTISPWAPVANMPYPYHKAQVWCYWLLARAMGYEYDKALLIYIDRWTTKLPNIRVFDVTPTEQEVIATRLLMDTFEDWSQREPDDLPPQPWSEPQDEDAWRCVRWQHISKGHYEWRIQCQWFGRCWPQYVDKSGEFQPELPF